jgi:hypothetical protein
MRRGQRKAFRYSGWIKVSSQPTIAELFDNCLTFRQTVYATANEVIVDLGTCRECDSFTLATLQRYEAITAAQWSAISDDPYLKHALYATEVLALPKAGDPFWQGLSELIQRPWFTRVWVIQEYVLAKHARFMVGDNLYDGSFLRDGVFRAYVHLNWLYFWHRSYVVEPAVLSDIEQLLTDMAEGSGAIRHMTTVERSLKDKKRWMLCEQLKVSTSIFKASNVRDKVYALIGLSSDPKLRERLPVDYNEALPDFAFRVSHYLARRENGAWMLSNCVGDRAGFFSWTLNLGSGAEKLCDNAVFDDLSSLIQPDASVHSDLYRSSANMKFHWRLSPGRTRTLMVRGRIIDELLEVMHAPAPEKRDLGDMVEIKQKTLWLREALHWTNTVALTHSLDLSGFIDQGSRTLITDHIHDPLTGKHTRTRDWADWEDCLYIWRSRWRVYSDKPYQEPTPATEREYSLLRVYGESLRFAMGRKLGLTAQSKVSCLIPKDAKVEDLVSIIQGCQIPFVLRKAPGQHGVYRIIGNAYVHGIMDGEAMYESEEEGQDIELV